MGAGTNCQKKLIALHNLDIPWRPLDMVPFCVIITYGNKKDNRTKTRPRASCYLPKKLSIKEKHIYGNIICREMKYLFSRKICFFIDNLGLNTLMCPHCEHTGVFTVHGYYRRNFKVFDNKITLRIMRVVCSECGHTHALTLEQNLAHNGHPVLRWMMDNIFIRRDPAGNIKPDKEKSTEKIDGVVAMIMALDRAIRCGCVSDVLINDSREMLVL